VTRDEIINDLHRRRPMGPGREEIQYTVREDYCRRSGRYKKVIIPSHDQYGYADEELFDLEFRSLRDLREYLRKRDFKGMADWHLGGRKRTLTRRSNLIWHRIAAAVNRIVRRGGEGIYEVSRGYSAHNMGHLYARSTSEALESARLFYGYLCKKGAASIHVKFVRRGSVESIYALNKQTKRKLSELICRSEREIEEQKKRISTYKAQLVTLKMVETQQVAVEMM